VDGPDLRRRKLLSGVVAGAAIMPLARSTSGFAVERHERLLRPPGALDEEHFLERCIRCGECMKVCPNNALHPTLTEAGLEGLWTPVLVPRTGYCEASCVLCSQVCPTGANLGDYAPEKRVGPWELGADTKPVKLGTRLLRSWAACLPWAMATEWHRLREWCPTSPKAIYLRQAEAVGREGKRQAGSNNPTSIPASAWAAARANTRVQCRTARRFTSPALVRAAREPTRSCLNRGKRRPKLMHLLRAFRISLLLACILTLAAGMQSKDGNEVRAVSRLGRSFRMGQKPVRLEPFDAGQSLALHRRRCGKNI